MGRHYQYSGPRRSHNKRLLTAVLWALGGIVLTSILVLVLPVFGASLAVLATGLGLLTILLGVYGLATFRDSESEGVWAFAAPIALVLAGSLLMGPTWGTGLGLGILGGTALYLATRDQGERS